MIIAQTNDFSLDKAEIIAFFVESFLSGASMLLVALTIWVLVYQRKTKHLNRPLVFITCLMAFLGTLHLAIDLSRILQGFINESDTPGGPIGYFEKLFLWSHVFKTAIFAVQTIIADSFAAYRCWVVWDRSWAVIIPALFVAGTLVTGVGIVHGCAVLKDGENVFAGSLSGWITSFFSLTLATNIVCTSLIAIRIWYITRNVSCFSGQKTLMFVVIIIVESGAIYSVSCVTLLSAYVLGSNAQYPALDGTFPVISIVFNLIIVRIALGIAHGGASDLRTTGNPTALGDNTPSHMSHGHTQYPLRSLGISVYQPKENESTPVKDSESFTSGAEGTWNAI